jgi:acyl-CoA synthetase (AMP-forming)/AMP-acid ligase II
MLANRAAGAPAVFTPSGTWSTAELLARSAAAASWLDELGAPPEQPVPALLSPSAEGLALAIGAAASGRPLAPIGPRLSPLEVGACVRGLGTRLLVTDAGAAELADRVAGEVEARVRLPAFSAAGAALDLDRRPDALVAILHTSGTTGLPRPVELREDRMAARVVVNRAVVGIGPDAVYTSASGFHHIAGLGMQLAAGAAVALMPRFDVETSRAVGHLGSTHALLVPTMIERLLAAGALAKPSLRVLQYGAAPIHPDTLVAALNALPGVELVHSHADHLRALAGASHLLGSVGRAVPGTELRLEDRAADGVGELVARGPHLFRLDPDGWLRTGDLARIDGSGYVYLAGRKGDRIIRGGENVYPGEVEEALRLHPAVADVAVVGVPDRELGEIVRAHVVRAPGSDVGADELRQFARERLSAFKVPAAWVFETELPRSSLGKVVRRRLLER